MCACLQLFWSRLWRRTAGQPRVALQLLLQAMSSSASNPGPASRKAPGGARQHMLWAREEEKAQERKSQLAKMLLESWAWGFMTGPTVQTLASAALADGASGSELISLSKIGGSGVYPGNMHRDMRQLVKPIPLYDALQDMQVWVRKPGAGGGGV